MDNEEVSTLIQEWKTQMSNYVKAAEKISTQLINIIAKSDESIYEEIVPDLGLLIHLSI